MVRRTQALYFLAACCAAGCGQDRTPAVPEREHGEHELTVHLDLPWEGAQARHERLRKAVRTRLDRIEQAERDGRVVDAHKAYEEVLFILRMLHLSPGPSDPEALLGGRQKAAQFCERALECEGRVGGTDIAAAVAQLRKLTANSVDQSSTR